MLRLSLRCQLLISALRRLNTPQPTATTRDLNACRASASLEVGRQQRWRSSSRPLRQQLAHSLSLSPPQAAARDAQLRSHLNIANRLVAGRHLAALCSSPELALNQVLLFSLWAFVGRPRQLARLMLAPRRRHDRIRAFALAAAAARLSLTLGQLAAAATNRDDAAWVPQAASQPPSRLAPGRNSNSSSSSSRDRLLRPPH